MKNVRRQFAREESSLPSQGHFDDFPATVGRPNPAVPVHPSSTNLFEIEISQIHIPVR
jgi:hypothetical protein